jgi:hypothetical protein
MVAQSQLCLVTLLHNMYKLLWAQSLVVFLFMAIIFQLSQNNVHISKGSVDCIMYKICSCHNITVFRQHGLYV